MAKSLTEPLGRLSMFARLFVLVTGVVALSGCQQADRSEAQNTLSLLRSNEALRLEIRALRKKLYESETRRLLGTQPDLGMTHSPQGRPLPAPAWLHTRQDQPVSQSVEWAERLNAQQMRRYQEHWRIRLKESRRTEVPPIAPSEP